MTIRAASSKGIRPALLEQPGPETRKISLPGTETTAVATDVAVLDALPKEQQELAVTMMLDQGRQWLERALEATNPAREVSEFKAFAATVAEAARQKKLSEGIQLDAVEMVRRSERALGVAIRKGQDAGEIAERFSHPGYGNQHVARRPQESTGSPDDFFSGGKERTQTYAMTDGVSDEQFEEALAEAKDEGNLSRANVVRKVAKLSTFKEEQDAKWERVELLANSGLTSPQIAREVGMSEQGLRDVARKRGIAFPADKVVGRTRRINPLDVLERIVVSLEGDVSVLGLVTYDDVTPEQAAEWLERLTEPLREIRKMQSRLKEITE